MIEFLSPVRQRARLRVAIVIVGLVARSLGAQQPAASTAAVPRVRLATRSGVLEGPLILSTPDSLLVQLSRGVGEDRVDVQRWVPRRCIDRAQRPTSLGDRATSARTRVSWLVPSGAVIGGIVGFVLTTGTERPHVYETTTSGPFARNLSVGAALGAGVGLIAGVWSAWRHPDAAWVDAPDLTRLPGSEALDRATPACDFRF